MVNRKYSIVFIFFLTFINVYSSNQAFYNIAKMGIQEGLPHIDILSISEDKKGFIWFVTRAGLCRYDGYNIQTYMVDNAAANFNRMNSMVLKDNNIWIGTSNGIVKFDIQKEAFEYKFDVLNKMNLNTSECRLFSLDSRDKLWVACNDKLYMISIPDNKIVSCQKPEDFYPPLSKYKITDVKEDRNGNIWISTNSGLLLFTCKHNELKFKSIINNKSDKFNLEDEYINTLHFDWNGDLYLGCYQLLQKITFKRNGLKISSDIDRIDRISLNNLSFFNITNTIVQPKLSIVNTITHDRSNQLWIGTQTGIIKYNPTIPTEALLIQESRNKPFSLASEMITSLFVNKEGTLFIGSVGGGLNILDTKQKIIHYIVKDYERPQFSLAENMIRSIAEEDNGDLWIGLQSKGLCHLDSKTLKIKNYDFGDGSSVSFNTKNYIRSLYLEDDRYLWIGGLDKVFCFDIRNRKEIPLSSLFYNKTKIKNGYFTDITSDKAGNLLIAGWGKGVVICKRNPNSRTDFRDIQIIDSDTSKLFHLNSNSANSFCIINDHTFLVSTQNGFERFETNFKGELLKITHYIKETNKKNQLSNPFVWNIIQIDTNSFYMGTLGGGVNKVTLVETDKNSEYGNYLAEVIGSNCISKVANVECLIRDNQHNLWVAGNTLMLYNEKKSKFEPYDFSWSTTSSIFKVGSCLKGKSGKIYLGSTQGLLFFNPSDIKPNTIPPLNEITGLFIHNIPEKPDSASTVLKKAIAYMDKITLSYKQNNFTIWFSSLQYVNQGNTNYKYMLEGYDEDWIETTGKKPFASYLNLKYGRYKFKVISSNSDGVWNEKPRVLDVLIKPPFYRTTVAYIIYLMVVVFLIRFIIVSKTRFYAVKKDLELEMEKELHNEELFQEKASFFTHLSHELRTPLTLIFSPLKEIVDNEKDSRLKNQLKFVYRNAEKMLYMVNKLIEFRKVESDASKLEVVKADINSFVRQISTQYTNWAERKQIEFDINIPADAEYICFDAEKVESIVNNLLTNAFKYSPENGSINITVTNIKAEISLRHLRKNYTIGNPPENSISILISDNGFGVSAEILEKLFDNFYQEKIRVSEGFGIGLSLVKRLILLHKGYLEISSEKDAGTSILVLLPGNENAYTDLERKADFNELILSQNMLSPDKIHTEIEYTDFIVNDETIQKLTTNRVSGKILIIEDDIQIRNYLRLNLRRIFTVFDVSRGETGYEFILNSMPDLIICDKILPDIDGIEICRRVKANENTSHIPFILITGKTDFAVRYEAACAGIDQFIEKPFSISYIIALIVNMLQNRYKLINKLSRNVFNEAYSLSTNQKDNELIKKIVSLIHEKLDDPDFVVDDLYMKVGLARSIFYSKVKQITGKTPNDLIRDIRLEEAISKMANENLSVSEAAYKVGMTPTYFSKAFKLKFKKSPSEYIKEKTDVNSKL